MAAAKQQTSCSFSKQIFKSQNIPRPSLLLSLSVVSPQKNMLGSPGRVTLSADTAEWRLTLFVSYRYDYTGIQDSAQIALRVQTGKLVCIKFRFGETVSGEGTCVLLLSQICRTLFQTILWWPVWLYMFIVPHHGRWWNRQGGIGRRWHWPWLHQSWWRMLTFKRNNHIFSTNHDWI